MAERHEDLFPELEPPPGGTARLMARIDAAERASRRRRVWVAGISGVAAAAVAVVIAVAPRVAGRPGDTTAAAWREAPALVSLGIGERMAEPVEVPSEARGGIVAVRVPTDDPKVVLYLVGSAVRDK